MTGTTIIYCKKFFITQHIIILIIYQFPLFHFCLSLLVCAYTLRVQVQYSAPSALQYSNSLLWSREDTFNCVIPTVTFWFRRSCAKGIILQCHRMKLLKLYIEDAMESITAFKCFSCNNHSID